MIDLIDKIRQADHFFFELRFQQLAVGLLKTDFDPIDVRDISIAKQ